MWFITLHMVHFRFSKTKSMDSIYAMNGKSVEVDNTDAEGRLILSGSYYYYFLVRGGS